MIAAAEVAGAAVGSVCLGVVAEASDIASPGELLNWGIAGAVIAVVILFLRFMSADRQEQREWITAREEAWSKQVLHLTQMCHENHERIAQSTRSALETHAALETRAAEENARAHKEIAELLKKING